MRCNRFSLILGVMTCFACFIFGSVDARAQGDSPPGFPATPFAFNMSAPAVRTTCASGHCNAAVLTFPSGETAIVKGVKTCDMICLSKETVNSVHVALINTNPDTGKPETLWETDLTNVNPTDYAAIQNKALALFKDRDKGKHEHTDASKPLNNETESPARSVLSGTASNIDRLYSFANAPLWTGKLYKPVCNECAGTFLTIPAPTANNRA